VNVFNAPFPACDADATNPAVAGAIRAFVVTSHGVTNHLTLRRTYLVPGDTEFKTRSFGGLYRRLILDGYRSLSFAAPCHKCLEEADLGTEIAAHSAMLAKAAWTRLVVGQRCRELSQCRTRLPNFGTRVSFRVSDIGHPQRPTAEDCPN